MLGRRVATCGALLVAVLALTAGEASAARTFPDAVGDVGGGRPDIVSVRISDTRAKVVFRIRFATPPPLRVASQGGWVDMLLVGIDLPPLGPLPVAPGGAWRGADLATGTHGPSKRGVAVALPDRPGGRIRQVARFPIVTKDVAITFAIPRAVFGRAAWFTFAITSAREAADGRASGGELDTLPAWGTLRYVMTA